MAIVQCLTPLGARWGRWHDNRHTLVTELAESGAGDEVIMSIAGHVSRAMLSRYSHVRMEAKWRALDEIAARQRGADEKRKDAEFGGGERLVNSIKEWVGWHAGWTIAPLSHMGDFT